MQGCFCVRQLQITLHSCPVCAILKLLIAKGELLADVGNRAGMQGTPLRLLIVEDSPDDAELLLMRLEEEGFSPVHRRVDNRSDYLEALKNLPLPDIILSDWSLPGFGGLEALGLLNEKSLDLPFIIVSGKIGEEAAIDVLRRGAYDYVSKDNLSRVGRAVRHALEARRRKQEAREAEAALRASEAKYRAFADANLDVVFIKDHSGRFVMINKAAENYYRRPEPEILGRMVTDLLPAALAAQCAQGDKAVLAGSGIVTDIERLRGRIFESRKFPIVMGDETMIGGYIRDITESSISERELEMEVKISAVLRDNRSRDGILSGTLALLEELDGTESARFDDTRAKAGGIVDLPASDHSPDGSSGPIQIRLPLDAHNRYLGDIVVNRKAEPEPDELDILLLVARIVANALHLAELREETEDRLRKLTALSLIDESISGAVDLGATLGLILDQAMALLRADAASIFLLDEDGDYLRLAVSKGFRTKSPPGERVALGQPYIGIAASERKTVSVSDFSDLDPDSGFARLLRDEGFTACHSTPLIVQSKLLGAMGIYPRTALSSGPEWLGFFETIARQAAIAIDNKTMYHNEQKAREELAVAYDATIEGWSRAMDLRDKDTEGHSRRVTELALALARKLGIEGEALVHLKRGALLHDIGKVGVPDSVLLKPGPLTEEEWAIMKRHPDFAVGMLSPVAYLRPALEIPYGHHEKWDGSGYPKGLAGEAIPMAARIFAIVDVWDALTSDRPYRAAWTREKTLEHIKSQIGKHFDPRVGEAFIAMIADY